MKYLHHVFTKWFGNKKEKEKTIDNKSRETFKKDIVKKNISKQERVDYKKECQEHTIKLDSNLKLLNLSNRNNAEVYKNISVPLQLNNIECNEIRRFYINNNNSFTNSDGLTCKILSAVYCDKTNVLFYLFVFSFINVDKYFLELIKIHIRNVKTKDCIVKKTGYIIVNNEEELKKQNYRIFTNVKIAMKIQENKQLSHFAFKNTFIQDINLDNLFYIIEYRKWNTLNECIHK